MNELLRDLLVDLAEIADLHEEINDSDVEELMTQCVFEHFLKPKPDLLMPESFRMYTPEGDTLIKKALVRFIERAASLADRLGLSFQDRLAAFQDLECTYGPSELCYNDFFDYISPESYDASGNEK